MGGKALLKFGIETERKSTVEHIEIENYMLSYSSSKFNTLSRPVKFYRNKESHGDCDIIVLNNGKLGDIYSILTNDFGQINKNGNVYSFEYTNYQIDFIFLNTTNYEISQFFFDWDPIGNLLGKLAHSLGLKFGFDGLQFPFRGHSGTICENIQISKDPRKIYEFLGCDFDRYLEGFDSLEDIFNYITSSKHFDFGKFKYENLYARDRKRNKKRDTFNKFIEHCNKKDADSQYSKKNKDHYIHEIDSYFPESQLLKRIEELNRKNDLSKIINEKFNGNLIMKLTGLSGKELGNFIFQFKRIYGKDFDSFILNISETRLHNLIINLKKNKRCITITLKHVPV
jgi:SepF-like predicted cell division protein (DUF552 family)